MRTLMFFEGSEIRELKKNVDKVNMKISQLQKANFDQQISIDLFYEISALLRRTIVNYCIAELNEDAYNILIIDIESAIGSLREKDERFNSTFNKRIITR